MFAVEFLFLGGVLLASGLLVVLQVCFDNTKAKKRLSNEQQLLRSLRGINYQLKRQAQCNEAILRLAVEAMAFNSQLQEAGIISPRRHQEEEEEEPLSRFSPNSSRDLGEEAIPM